MSLFSRSVLPASVIGASFLISDSLSPSPSFLHENTVDTVETCTPNIVEMERDYFLEELRMEQRIRFKNALQACLDGNAHFTLGQRLLETTSRHVVPEIRYYITHTSGLYAEQCQTALTLYDSVHDNVTDETKEEKQRLNTLRNKFALYRDKPWWL